MSSNGDGNEISNQDEFLLTKTPQILEIPKARSITKVTIRTPGQMCIIPIEAGDVVVVDPNDKKYYGYNRFVPGQKMYRIAISGTIHGSIDDAFDLIRDWSDSSMFWSMTFDSTSLTEEKGEEDMVGDIRNFRQNGRSYSEILLHVDRMEHRLVYGLVDASEPSPAVVTTIDIDTISETPSQFDITITSNFQPPFPFPALVNTIKEAQKAAYNGIIAAMKKHFNPQAANLKISVLSGYVWGFAPDYIAFKLSSGQKNFIRTSRKGSPRSNEDLSFTVMDLDEQLLISIHDGQLFLEDRVLASAYIPIRDLKNGAVDITMKDLDGNGVGQYTLDVEIDVLEDDPIDRAKEIGTVTLLVLQDFSEKLMEIVVNGIGKDPHVAETWDYEEHPKSLGRLPKYCKILPVRSVIMPKRIGEIMQRVMECLYSQMPLLGLRSELASMAEKLQCAPESVDTERFSILNEMAGELLKDPYLIPFRMWMPKPENIIAKLHNLRTCDQELAAQLIRGVNPMKVSVVRDISLLPNELSVVTDDRGRTVEEIIEDSAMFYCDYWELQVGQYDEEKGCYVNQGSYPGGLGRAPATYWYAPRLACYKNADGHLDILGFTLTRFEDRKNVVYNKETHPNIYKIAKLHLTCADNQHHQFVSHLGFAHLAMEVFAIANNNAFPIGADRHPIGKLLEPHFQDTIGINFLARQTLVSTVAPLTDATFSPGTSNGMKIFAAAYKDWDIVKNNFPNDLMRRGFDEECSEGLPGYHYRDDGFKVWNAYESHFGAIVDLLYEGDDSVRNDLALKGWCEELRDSTRGDLASFPACMDSKDTLVEVLTSIAFYCSAQHAAVNFSQLRYVSYVPNRPDSMVAPMPAPDGRDIDADQIFKALPSQQNAEFQAMFAYLLSTPPDNPMSTYCVTMADFPVETEAFLEKLKDIHGFIAGRNSYLKETGEVPYEYMDPMQIPQSINI